MEPATVITAQRLISKSTDFNNEQKEIIMEFKIGDQVTPNWGRNKNIVGKIESIEDNKWAKVVWPIIGTLDSVFRYVKFEDLTKI